MGRLVGMDEYNELAFTVFYHDDVNNLTFGISNINIKEETEKKVFFDPVPVVILHYPESYGSVDDYKPVQRKSEHKYVPLLDRKNEEDNTPTVFEVQEAEDEMEFERDISEIEYEAFCFDDKEKGDIKQTLLDEPINHVLPSLYCLSENKSYPLQFESPAKLEGELKPLDWIYDYKSPCKIDLLTNK